MSAQSLYEEQRELQRRILYNKTCCCCNSFNKSCVYARSSDKATVVEYCICDKNSVMKKLIISAFNVEKGRRHIFLHEI